MGQLEDQNIKKHTAPKGNELPSERVSPVSKLWNVILPKIRVES
jgi:hypothetical protein